MIDGPRLVAGIDSSTQSCKVVVRDAGTGALVRQGRARHPDGTEVHPDRWWEALQEAIHEAGGLDDVAAVSVGGQQHGMVCLDEDGAVVRPALLWNDTRSAGAARDLVDELGGPQEGGRAWADAVGVVPVASFTVTKLRWLAEHEPEHARRTAAVCLPHDWLTWRLSGSTDLADLTTDRSDASGTGYWSAATGSYRTDLLERAFGAVPGLPRVVAPGEVAATMGATVLGAGAGDNAAAALGLGAGEGDVVVSIGTSGVVTAVTDVAPVDPTGSVAGFADATGLFLPLVATLNGARVLDAAARLLGVDHDTLSALALEAPSGGGRTGAGALPRGRAHPQPPRRDRRPARADPRHGHPTGAGPRHGRGSRLQPGRRSRRGRRDRGPARAPCWWAGARRPRPCARSPPRCSASRWTSPRRGSTSPTVPLGRPRGRCLARTLRPPGSARAPGDTHADPAPAVRQSLRRGPGAAPGPDHLTKSAAVLLDVMRVTDLVWRSIKLSV